jgi:general stress protein 26
MSDANKQEIATFLEARFLCVISTVDENARPESAFVGYSSNENLEVIIGTSNESRKVRNISQNKAVALVIADTSGEVQYEGNAEAITAQEYESFMAEGRFKKLPGFDKYRNDPTQIYLKVTPTWIRFIVHGKEDRIEELRQFA